MRVLRAKAAPAGRTSKRTTTAPPRLEEIMALLREARAWAESGLPPVVSRYSTRFWLPLLRPALWSLVHVMRDEAFSLGAVVNGWGLCQLSHQDLAVRIGAESRKRVLRLLKDPGLERLVHADARLRVTGTGERRRTTNSYWVVMSDPPIPAHDAVVAVEEADRYLNAAGIGADWHVPEVSQQRTPPGDERVTRSHVRVSRAETPRGDQGVTIPPSPVLPGSSPLRTGQQHHDVLDDDADHITAYTALVECGVAGHVAKALLEKHDARYILRHVDHHRHLISTRRHRLTNPPGLLVSAIRSGEPPAGPGAVTESERARTPPAGAGGPVETLRLAEERRARLLTFFRSLPETTQRGVEAQAKTEVAETLGPALADNAMAITSRLLTLVEEMMSSEAARSPEPGAAPAELGARFWAWYQRKLGERGVEMRPGVRLPAAVRARRVAWRVLAALGLSRHEIERTTGVSRGAARERSVSSVEASALGEEAARWKARFLEALEV